MATAQRNRKNHPGHRRRRRRAVRRPPAGDPERARDHERRQPPGARSRAASRREHRAHHRHGHRPKAWCAARKSPTPARRSRCRSATRRSAASSTSSASRSTKPARSTTDAAPRHPPGSADLHRAVDRSADPRHRHQGRRPARALRQGRQDRPVRRRRRRQDRADHGADQQRRQGARRLFGVRRRRRAHPRGQRPLSRDDRVRRQQGPAQGLGRGLQVRAGVRPDERAAGRPRPRRPLRPDRRRALPRPGPGRAVLRRQHLPLHAGRLGSVGAARPHSVGGGLSADARHRHGRAAGAHHHHAPRARSPRCRRFTCRPTT